MASNYNQMDAEIRSSVFNSLRLSNLVTDISKEVSDIFEISDTNDRIVIYQLMKKCDEKYGINATYKDLLLEDQELVLKYI